MKSLNFKFVFVFLLSAALILSISACGSASDDSADTESPAGESTEAPAGDIVAAFPFTNTGEVDVCEIYMAPSGETSWGPDQLEGKTIPAGETFTLNNIPTGVYDISVVFCNGSEATVEQVDVHN